MFELVTIDADGTSTVVADTRGELASFGLFRPPTPNKRRRRGLPRRPRLRRLGDLRRADPINDRVISTGDMLDGSTVQDITICEEGLSDSGELAFVAQLEAPDTPEGFRVAVFRATSVP